MKDLQRMHVGLKWCWRKNKFGNVCTFIAFIANILEQFFILTDCVGADS